MHEHLLIGLSMILALGIAAQWVAWKTGAPAILVLLVFGFLAGPVAGYLHPDELFGDLLAPAVSLAVALILFDGGLNLRLAELRGAGRAFLGLILIGIPVTWFLAATMAHRILGFPSELALLFGAILVITGPTVILPILRQVRPSGNAAAAIKWEGIVNDPIGALLCVLVFEAILSGNYASATSFALRGIALTMVYGAVTGFAGFVFVTLLLRRYLIPGFLQSPMMLAVAVMVYTAANLLQEECGLLAVTLMGIAVANQRYAPVKHIMEFKENIGVILVSSLFIVLTARMSMEDLRALDLRALLYVAGLLVVVRPVSVFLATVRTKLNWREKVFLAGMAPRGIVAASVTSVFALRLVSEGYSEAERMVPIMFLIVSASVAIYGLGAAPLARQLGLATPKPQGALIFGAHKWAREIAEELQETGYPVTLVDSNYSHVSAARMGGLKAMHGNIVSEALRDRVDLHGIGKLIALTSNEEANSLAVLHFEEIFDRSQVYQLPPDDEQPGIPDPKAPRHLHGRYLFAEDATFSEMDRRFREGAVMKRTRLTEEFDFEAYRTLYGDAALPLFLIDEDERLIPFTATDPPRPRAGTRIVGLVKEEGEEERR